MRRPERPPVSRVREIRTHGLNGGLISTRPLCRPENRISMDLGRQLQVMQSLPCGLR